jgi:hypothetical protein
MAYDNRDPAYVPSQQALAADAYIASTSPETHPDEYTYYPGFGHTYTGPMANYTSGTEYNTWLNSSLGGSMFGSGQQVANSQNNNPYIQSINTQALLNAFPDAQDTATYLSDTNFPDLNPNQVGTVNPIGPAPEPWSSSNVITNINTDDAIVPPPLPPPNPNTASTPQYTAADVNALYNQYLNRDAEEAGLNYWLNSLNTGTSMEDVVYNIMQSDEYKSLQGQAGPGTTEEEQDSTGLPPVVDNGSSENVLTAAGLANALSMLIPQPEPTPPFVVGSSSGSSFSPAPIQGLSFSGQELAPIDSSNQIDYVKQMRAGLFKDLV